MKVSNCCGAIFYEPGFPENDICSCCNEHADDIDQDNPSIDIVELGGKVGAEPYPEYDEEKKEYKYPKKQSMTSCIGYRGEE